MKKLLVKEGKIILLEVNNNKSKKTVILSHGFLSNKNRPIMKQTATELARAGFRTIRFNYGTELISERLIKLNIIINHFSNKSDSIGLMGLSMGGMMSILGSTNPKVNSIALVNSVYDTFNAYENYIKHRPLTLAFFNKVKDEFLTYNLKSIITNLNKPVLVITGTKDKIIPSKQMKQLYSDVKADKKLVILRGCGHAIWSQNYLNRVKEEVRDWFLKTL